MLKNYPNTWGDKELSAPIFDIQRFSIHDGPGIRTLVFLKGCNLRCDWCQNPESQQAKPKIAFYEGRCKQDFECKNACREGAIRLEGFRIDYDCCTHCMKCIDICAHEALKPIGSAVTPEALMEQILKDKNYYTSSGGGVTFSGGEPTLYPKFMACVLNLCSSNNIHTTLETCGTFSFVKWQTILRQLDLIYFDLKIIDSDKHKLATGSDNQNILENAKLLIEHKYPVEFRLALIPDYTDDIENLNAIAQLLKTLKRTKLHLLSYHNMGEAKIAIIDGSQRKLALSNYSKSKLKEVTVIFKNLGIETVLN